MLIEPIPWSIAQLSAYSQDQERVDDWGRMIFEGVGKKEHFGTFITLTVALAGNDVPPNPLQVIVKVYAPLGFDIGSVPEADFEPLQSPEAEQESACVEVQVRFMLFGYSTIDGAESPTTGRQYEAPQLALEPPFDPLQVQFHVDSDKTGADARVPTLQRLALSGISQKLGAFPQEPLMGWQTSIVGV